MENKLREYAKLLIEVGLNVQKGQTVVIRCPVECAFFARLCASAAYDIGCRDLFRGGEFFGYALQPESAEIRNNCLTVTIGYNF